MINILAYQIYNPEEWIEHINNCGAFANPEEVIQSRANVCLVAMRRDWTVKLEERGFTIIEATVPTYAPQPSFVDYDIKLNREDYETDDDYEQATAVQNQTNQQNYEQALNAVNLQNKELEDAYLEEKRMVDLAFAELVFAQPDYQSLAQKEAKTPEQLLSEAKEQKIAQLEVAYTNAQVIKVVNGHTFLIPIAGDYFNQTISGQFYTAAGLGKADLIYPDINGQIVFLPKIPISEWIKFYEPAKDIGIANKLLKTYKTIEISSCATPEAVNVVNLDIFPSIQEVILDI